MVEAGKEFGVEYVARRFMRWCHGGGCFGRGWVLVPVCRGGGDPMKCGSCRVIGSWSKS